MDAAPPIVNGVPGAALPPVHCNLCHCPLQYNSTFYSNPEQDYDMCLSCHATNGELAHQHDVAFMTGQTRSLQILQLFAAHAAQNQPAAPQPFVDLPALFQTAPHVLPKYYKCWHRDGSVHVKTISPNDPDAFLHIMKTHTRVHELSIEDLQVKDIDPVNLCLGGGGKNGP